jgi:hypothetical protein
LTLDAKKNPKRGMRGPILIALVAFALSLLALGLCLAFIALVLFGGRPGESPPEAEAALWSAGLLAFALSAGFAFRLYRRASAVAAGTFVKPAGEEATIKRRVLFLVSGLGFALLLAGLVRLDLPLLIDHESAEGRITAISVAPYQHSFRSLHRTTAHYAYVAKDGSRYQRTASGTTLGYETEGDEFTVLYRPSQPERHRVLTLWGQLDSLALLGFGLLIGLPTLRAARRIRR